MATSGYKTVTYASLGGNQFKFEWERISVSTTDNISTIAWRLYLISSSYGAITSTVAKQYTVTIDGQKFQGYSYVNIGNNSTKQLASGTAIIPHNADGTKTFSYTFFQQLNVFFGGYSVASASGSGSGTLDAIPKGAQLLAAPNFTDEDSPTITYTNPSGEAAATLQVSLKFGDDAAIYYKDISKTGTSFTLNFTDAERKTLRQQVKSGNSREVKVFIITTLNGTIYYSSLTRTFSIVNGMPTLSPTMRDANNISTGVTGNNQIIVKKFSNVYVTAAPVAQKEATITSTKITCGSQTINAASGVFYKPDSNTITFSTTDSRGNTTTVTKTYSAVEYTPVTCYLEIKPPSTSGSAELTITGNYFNGSFGAKSNTISVAYRYKVSGGSFGNWVVLSDTTVADGKYTLNATVSGLDYQSTYIFEARAFDALQTVFFTAEPIKLSPLFDWGEDNFNFNIPVMIEGQPLDYVVEQGEKDGWYYKKWQSGAAEAWYSATVTGINVGAYNLDGFYYSGSKQVNFPFMFTKVIYTNASGGSTGNLNFVRPFNNTLGSMTYLVVGNTSGVTNATVKINLEVKGLWK